MGCTRVRGRNFSNNHELAEKVAVLSPVPQEAEASSLAALQGVLSLRTTDRPEY